MYSTQTPLVQIARISHILRVEGFNDQVRCALIALGASTHVIALIQQSPTAIQQIFDGNPPFDRWNDL